ncbi:MAG: RNA 2',3'-cyclic phosphodiesterase [Peptococcaceae bacterium]|nr:RNA 2',3'-cyclic phosphodiesterase [Peptococcaceae bacterium]
MRLFISINLCEASISELENWQQNLRSKGVKGYWRKKDNLHITLRFLGEIDPVDLPMLKESLKKSSGQIGRFELVLGGLGVFPNLANPRILWTGIKNEPKLFTLQKSIEQNTKDFGKLENKKYTPHLTLASGGIQGIEMSTLKWGESLVLREKVTGFYLMSSVVEKGIRKYVEIESYHT